MTEKSTPSFASLDDTMVASNIVSPIFTTTDPSACFANFPVSRLTIRPSPKSNECMVPNCDICFFDLCFGVSETGYIYVILFPILNAKGIQVTPNAFLSVLFSAHFIYAGQGFLVKPCIFLIHDVLSSQVKHGVYLLSLVENVEFQNLFY